MEKTQIISKNIEKSKEEIKKEITNDYLIIFFTRIVEDLKKYRNPNFYGRIKEIYELLYPYSNKTSPKEIFLEFKESRMSSLYGLNLNSKEKMYVHEFLRILDKNCKIMYKNQKSRFEEILFELVKKYFPNSQKHINSYIFGKLVSSVGGAKNLSRMPSSTIQLIGAEKAMFRHIAKGNNCPKYGLIYHSRKIKKSDNKGKTARQLANKLAISVKRDYFQYFAR